MYLSAIFGHLLLSGGTNLYFPKAQFCVYPSNKKDERRKKKPVHFVWLPVHRTCTCKICTFGRATSMSVYTRSMKSLCVRTHTWMSTMNGVPTRIYSDSAYYWHAAFSRLALNQCYFEDEAHSWGLNSRNISVEMQEGFIAEAVKNLETCWMIE